VILFEIEDDAFDSFGFVHNAESAFLTTGGLCQDIERRAVAVLPQG
jgi:hypothetical protein